MIKKGVLALAGAASLLFGSTVATAQTAQSLSVADSVRAGATMTEANAQDDEGIGSSVLIGVGIFVVIVIAIYFIAESDDPVSA